MKARHCEQCGMELTHAEINFHINEPPIEFVAMCLEAEVKLTFGGDAHSLYEIGDFALHLDLLRRAGFHGEPSEVLLPLPGAINTE